MSQDMIFSVPVTVYGTVYVRAKSAEEAHGMAQTMCNTVMEVSSDCGGLVSGVHFTNPDMPDVSLSPYFTIGDTESVDHVEFADVIV